MTSRPFVLQFGKTKIAKAWHTVYVGRGFSASASEKRASSAAKGIAFCERYKSIHTRRASHLLRTDTTDLVLFDTFRERVVHGPRPPRPPPNRVLVSSCCPTPARENDSDPTLSAMLFRE